MKTTSDSSIGENKRTAKKSNLSSFVTVDWFWAHQESLEKKWQKSSDDSNNQFLQFLWPVSNEYFSPLNAVFLSSTFDAELFNRQPFWLAREGLIPLLWFFKTNPHPGGFKQKILIHREFAPYVPNSWRPQTGTYVIKNKSHAMPKKDSRPKKLLLAGLASDVYCSLGYLKETLEKIVDFYGPKQIAALEKSCFFIDKQNNFSRTFNQEFFCEFIFQVCRILGSENIKTTNWMSLESTASFEDWDLAELNEGLLFADSFLSHSVLQRGARLLDLEKVETDSSSRFIQLSPYHGMSIQENLKGECMIDVQNKTMKEAESYLNKFETAMRSNANLNLPWPSWFMEWGKSLTKDHSKHSSIS